VQATERVRSGSGANRSPTTVTFPARRGIAMFKALGLGATAVGIGRPNRWGSGSFGQSGVEAVLAILRHEVQTIMREAGTTSIAKITRSYIFDRPL
jgi:isopentenyl diphosphate isomerase/L-lactate dehydrogenase-like FMN-dependent dehydrogenase